MNSYASRFWKRQFPVAICASVVLILIGGCVVPKLVEKKEKSDIAKKLISMKAALPIVVITNAEPYVQPSFDKWFWWDQQVSGTNVTTWPLFYDGAFIEFDVEVSFDYGRNWSLLVRTSRPPVRVTANKPNAILRVGHHPKN